MNFIASLLSPPYLSRKSFVLGDRTLYHGKHKDISETKQMPPCGIARLFTLIIFANTIPLQSNLRY